MINTTNEENLSKLTGLEEVRKQIKGVRHLFGDYKGKPKFSGPLGNYLYEDELEQIEQIIDQHVQAKVLEARVDELSHLYVYDPRQAVGIIKTDIESDGDEMYKGQTISQRISALTNKYKEKE